jgi:hypothetical protein
LKIRTLLLINQQVIKMRKSKLGELLVEMNFGAGQKGQQCLISMTKCSVGFNRISVSGELASKIVINTSIIWSVSGIHSFIDRPKGTTSNRAFFCHQIVPIVIANITFHVCQKSVK